MFVQRFFQTLPQVLQLAFSSKAKIKSFQHMQDFNLELVEHMGVSKK